MDDLISRQALLESIERISVKGNVLDDDWIYRFIQEFPSAQTVDKDINVPINDIISRQAAIKAICDDGTWLESQGCTEITMAERKQRDADILGELPSAQPERCEDCGNFNKARLLIPQPERKKGHWIVINESAGLYECDQCHERVCCVGKYCMNCGARMEEEDGNQS